MRIWIDDADLADDLSMHFERAGFAVERTGDVVAVRRASARAHDERRRELALHVAIWRAMHPRASVRILAD